MPCHWHKKSIFGDGPRVRLDRNGRARFKFLLRAHRSAHRLTADQVKVGEVLESALGDDGRLDLAHATIADRAPCHVATVKRALNRLRKLGLIDWTRRLMRGSDTGWRCEQTSNAYVLRPPACEAQPARPVKKIGISYCRRPTDEDAAARRNAAQQLLALGLPVPVSWNGEKMLTTRSARPVLAS
jgi:hypothetical protein